MKFSLLLLTFFFFFKWYQATCSIDFSLLRKGFTRVTTFKPLSTKWIEGTCMEYYHCIKTGHYFFRLHKIKGSWILSSSCKFLLYLKGHQRGNHIGTTLQLNKKIPVFSFSKFATPLTKVPVL